MCKMLSSSAPAWPTAHLELVTLPLASSGQAHLFCLQTLSVLSAFAAVLLLQALFVFCCCRRPQMACSQKQQQQQQHCMRPSMTWPLSMPPSLHRGKHCTDTADVLSPVLQLPPLVSSAVVLQAPRENRLQDSRRVQRCKEVSGPGLCICEAAGAGAFRAGCHAGAGWGVHGCPCHRRDCQFQGQECHRASD